VGADEKKNKTLVSGTNKSRKVKVVSGTNNSRKENATGLKALFQKEIYELKLCRIIV
jgi:hypothetical protein